MSGAPESSEPASGLEPPPIALPAWVPVPRRSRSIGSPSPRPLHPGSPPSHAPLHYSSSSALPHHHAQRQQQLRPPLSVRQAHSHVDAPFGFSQPAPQQHDSPFMFGAAVPSEECRRNAILDWSQTDGGTSVNAEVCPPAINSSRSNPCPSASMLGASATHLHAQPHPPELSPRDRTPVEGATTAAVTSPGPGTSRGTPRPPSCRGRGSFSRSSMNLSVPFPSAEAIEHWASSNGGPSPSNGGSPMLAASTPLVRFPSPDQQRQPPPSQPHNSQQQLQDQHRGEPQRFPPSGVVPSPPSRHALRASFSRSALSQSLRQQSEPSVGPDEVLQQTGSSDQLRQHQPLLGLSISDRSRPSSLREVLRPSNGQSQSPPALHGRSSMSRSFGHATPMSRSAISAAGLGSAVGFVSSPNGAVVLSTSGGRRGSGAASSSSASPIHRHRHRHSSSAVVVASQAPDERASSNDRTSSHRAHSAEEGRHIAGHGFGGPQDDGARDAVNIHLPCDESNAASIHGSAASWASDSVVSRSTSTGTPRWRRFSRALSDSEAAGSTRSSRRSSRRASGIGSSRSSAAGRREVARPARFFFLPPRALEGSEAGTRAAADELRAWCDECVAESRARDYARSVERSVWR